MRGGNRKGAGRKNINDEYKKKGHNLYITDSFYEEINQLNIPDATSFSQKCVELIKMGISNMTEQLELFDNKTSNHPSPQLQSSSDKEFSCNIPLTFIDLFAGIGGIRKGFEDEFTQCVFSSEWDKYAAKTYEANYGELPAGDITQIPTEAIPSHDVLLAGFPCQPFSHIGKREGFEHETQGTLFFDILRIIKEKKPKMFLLENVKGLLTNDKGRTFEIILDSLKKTGYKVFFDVLDAQNFGLPQRRERVIIVGFRGDLGIKSFVFPQGDSELKRPIKDILEHNPTGYSISEHLQRTYLFKKDDNRPQLVDFKSDIQVNTLCASYHKIQRLTGTFVKDGDTGLRLFSELECKRLMGFPDDFIIPVSRTQMYRQFGNSVAVPMIKEVADAMKMTLCQALLPEYRKAV